jgi:hypothetical protein
MKKKVPFNYKFWKANPQTKLVTRDDEEAVILGENPNNEEYPLIGYVNSVESWTKNGMYRSGNESSYDLFMLQQVKEVVSFRNTYLNYISLYEYESIEEAINNRRFDAISIAKIVIVDGIIDFTKCETVHIYER